MTSEQQKKKLQTQIWQIANKVRGAVDGWDFKQYVLGSLFYRYISENFKRYMEAGDESINYAKLSDDVITEAIKTDAIKTKGYFIYPSQLFENVVENAVKNENLNTDLDEIFKKIEKSAVGYPSENDVKGLFADFDTTSRRLGNTVKERSAKLAEVLKGINELDFGKFEDNEIDIFGDAYEFLISNYAANAGKSGGEFFTPQCVSKLISKIALYGQKTINKVYDPAAGSGSLLLQAKKQLDAHIVEDGFFGQEINHTTYNLARMNMFLHNVNYNKFNIALGDTLTNPQFMGEKPFDAIVSNPPYSVDWVGNDNPILINDERFAPAGVLAPKSKADYAFIMHVLSYLSSKGRAAIVCFPGIFYRSGAEQKIRKYLVDNNYIETIMALPENLFYGTTIAVDILVLSKHKKDTKIQFIDVTSGDFYSQETNNNVLEPKHIEQIFDYFIQKENVPYISKLVDFEEIVKKDYDLSVATYVEKKNSQEQVDIEELNSKLDEIVKEIHYCRSEINSLIMEFGGINMKIIDEFNFCSDKEKFKKLESILDYEQPQKYSVSSTKYSNDKSLTPVLTAGQTFILGYTSETKGIYHASKNNPVIIFDDFTTSFHLVDFDFKVKSSALKILKAKSSFDGLLKYVFYAMKKIQYSPKTHARQWISIFSQFEIPTPQLTIQEEIVRILDKYTELEKELEQKLQEEIDIRKKQYEFYRNKLLTFSPKLKEDD